jgi:putative addiction module antidote
MTKRQLGNGLDKSNYICYNVGMASENAQLTAKIVKVGNSLGMILSKDVLARLNVSVGDSLFLIEGPGGYRLTPYDSEFEEQMAIARDIMKADRDILRELAK